MTYLLKKRKSFVWLEESEAAFVEMKTRMASHPNLVTLDVETKMYIACDASDRAIAGCLFQVIHECEHPICDISQKFNCHQKAYATIEKEALNAVRRFSMHFDSHEVIVYTDHDSLTVLDRMSNTNIKLLRWRLELHEYKILIKNRKWKNNVIPDILSLTSKSFK